MASGDTLVVFTAQHGVPPATLYAQQDTIAGASTPAEAIPVLDFASGVSEYIDFYGVVPENYDSGGITLTFIWCALGETTTTNECRWEAAFRAIEDDAGDLDTSAHTYQYNGVSAPPPSTAGEVSYDNITFTDGADSDNIDAGDAFILRVYRDHDHADDDCTGDASLLAVHMKET